MVGELQLLGGKYIEGLLTPSMRKRASRFAGTVTKRKKLGAGLVEVEVSLGTQFEFLPGQYVWLEVFDKAGKPFPHNHRAFSLLDAGNQTDKLHFVFKDNTESDFKKGVVLGGKVVVSGARGSSLVLDWKERTPLVALAGGTGVSPFMSLARSINAAARKRLKLVYCASQEQELVYLSELKELESQHKNFFVEPVVPKLNEDALKSALSGSFKQAQVAVVGPQGFVDAAFQMLQKLGVSRERMIFENFYPTDTHVQSLFQRTFDQGLAPVLLQGIEQSNFHVILTDINGVARYANPKACKMTGFSKEEIIGNTPRLWGGLNDPEYYRLLWAEKIIGQTHDDEIINQRKTGELYVAMAHIAPIYIEKVLVGFIATEEDITELKATQEALRISQERFALAVDGASAGIWDWDLASGKEWWSERFYELIGYKPSEFEATLENFQKLLHPDDAERTFALVEQCFKGQGDFRLEYRLRTKKQGYKWFLGTGVVSVDSAGKPLRMVGTIVDINTEVENRQKLSQQNEELQKFNNLLVGRELKMLELKETIKQLQHAQKKTI